jgi:putative membrane protein
MLRWLLATIHLLALPIGFAAVVARGRTLRGAPDRAALRRAFEADSWWGIAALLWIGTGTLRAFGGWEKGVPYYMHDAWFAMKMFLLLAILALEVAPMVALIRWRIRLRSDLGFLPGPTDGLARISLLQGAIVIVMAALAAGMARGLGANAF